MGNSDRIDALEARLQRAEDQLEIIQLINTYGPLVDSGESEAASALWVEGGAYDVGGITRLAAPDDLIAMYDSDGHQDLVKTGVSHLTATPRITLNGDEAEAVAYSFVVLKEGDRWFVWRASANHFSLRRTDAGWRIVERYNRVLDGSEASHDTLRWVMR